MIGKSFLPLPVKHTLHRWLKLLPTTVTQDHRLEREYAVIHFRTGGSEDWNLFLAAAVCDDIIREDLRFIPLEALIDFPHLR